MSTNYTLSISYLLISPSYRILFGFANDESYERISIAISNEHKIISSATIAARMRYCREMVTDAYIQHQKSLPKIGGPGIIVQVLIQTNPNLYNIIVSTFW